MTLYKHDSWLTLAAVMKMPDRREKRPGSQAVHECKRSAVHECKRSAVRKREWVMPVALRSFMHIN